MDNKTTSAAYISDISRKMKQYRINYPMSQQELSDKSGVSLRALKYFENGKGIQLENFIKLLMAMDLDRNLDVLIPDMELRPSAYLAKERNQQKKRVGRKQKNVEKTPSFKWGDEV